MHPERIALKEALATMGVKEEALEALALFREILVEGNRTQNLTRLISPEDYLSGHVADCIELVKSGFLNGTCFDLGSGCGVPGIPAALMEPTRDWILCDSEKRKTDFLADAVGRLGLERVRTVWGRADILLQSEPVDTVVSRAVGPVERIYGWISKCSTWNRLLLLKGPNWAQEWQTFIDYSGGKPPLRVEKEWKYEVGPESKSRTLVFLTRTN